MTTLNRLLNRVLRVALMVDRRTPVIMVYDTTNVMKLDIRCRFHMIKIMHTFVYSPLEFVDDYERTLATPSVRTRLNNAPILLQNFLNNSRYGVSLDSMGPLLWNSLPASLRNIRDPRLFKMHLKRFVLQYN